MNFNNDKRFITFFNQAADPEHEKELSKEEVLDSNDVELVVKYAKENRSQEAIDKARELLELARKIGEEVVQAFLNSFKECEAQKLSYLNFENTESGKAALSSLDKIPEPFKSQAYRKLEDYKEELTRNTELFEQNQSNPEKIWKEIFGFDYYNVPDFKERFKTFLFKDMGAISEKYYKKNNLEATQDPFALNFFVEDSENFNKAYNDEIKDADDKFGGFSKKQGGTTINVINTGPSSPDDNIRRGKDEVVAHEAEHVIHRKTNPIDAILLEPDVLEPWMDFDYGKNRLNHAIKFDFTERLKKAKDEVFAYFKGGR